MKTRVLLLTNRIMSYRLPIFNMLGEKYDFTVAYSLGTAPSTIVNFKIIYLSAWKIGRFVIHKQNIRKLALNYDVVIYTGDIAWLKYSFLPFFKNSYKTICWGIGVSASYNKAFDANKKWDIIRDFFYSKSDALLFYSDYPVNKYILRGFDRNRLFVANNTVKVTDTIDIGNKESFLFIGTLYKAKGVFELLNAYKSVYNQHPDIWDLKIVGGGDGYNDVKQWINNNAMTSKVHLLGPVYDELIKERLFKTSILCISPAQAGLGVLESMAHGTTFVTKEDAITGGERLNIKSGITGVLYKDPNELEIIINDAYVNPEKYRKIGSQARAYYKSYRTPEVMVRGFDAAISYVLNK